MPLLKTVAPEEATGKVEEAYSKLMKVARVIPKPFEMLSPSPDILTLQGQFLAYFFQHPNLGFPLLAHIRLLCAQACNYQYCIDFNTNMLKMLAGVDDEQMAALKADPGQAPLEEKDKAMLLFVLKAVQTPDAVEQKDVDALRGLGWDDRDILDAANHGAGMVSAGLMFRAFKMGE